MECVCASQALLEMDAVTATLLLGFADLLVPRNVSLVTAVLWGLLMAVRIVMLMGDVVTARKATLGWAVASVITALYVVFQLGNAFLAHAVQMVLLVALRIATVMANVLVKMATLGMVAASVI